MPSWWDDERAKADARRRQNRRSQAKEARVASEVGGRQMPGSGSSWRAPGDVKSDEDLLEHKFTDKRRFILTLEDWEQARSDALKSGREPGMIIEFARTGRRLLITELPD
jgi:hypothetical protein